MPARPPAPAARRRGRPAGHSRSIPCAWRFPGLWPSRSPRHRPEINQSDRLDPLGLDLIERPDAIGLGGKLPVDRVEPLVPVPLVRFELTLLVVVEA